MRVRSRALHGHGGFTSTPMFQRCGPSPVGLTVDQATYAFLAAVVGVRPKNVKTHKKKARTDGDLPPGVDTEVPE